MTKKLLLFALLIVNVSAFSQEITYDEFKTVIPFLVSEDYKGAFEATNVLLKKTTDSDDSDLKAQVTYMNIFASAGMVTADQMTYDDFEKNAKKFIGKRLKMSGHPCVGADEMATNSFKFTEEEGKGQQGSTITTNKAKTSILLFEYYKFPEHKNPEDYVGKTVRCGGVLESFELSPTRSKIWVARIHLVNSTVNLFMPR